MSTIRERLSETVGTAQGRVLMLDNAATTPSVNMDAINQHALKDLTENDVFVFQFELSNSNIDAYYTRMTKETLQNYANRINTAGVPLQPNHDGFTFPIGRIYESTVDRTDDGVDRLICNAYIVRGDENGDGNPSGDALIRKIETGVQKDVSIGFIPGGYTCSICGSDMIPGYFDRVMSDQCDHLPGAMYDGKVCYAWVEDGTILEGSLVYTGATPQAIIQKAVNAQRLGKLDVRVLHSVSQALNITFVTEDTPMKAKDLLTRVAQAPGLSETLKRNLEAKAEAVGDEGEEKGAEVIAEAVAEEVAEVKKENEELKPLAEEGRVYRTEVINATLDEGVRAMGTDFKREEMETTFRSMNLDVVKTMKNQYTAMVEKIGERINVGEQAVTPLTDEKPDEKKAPVHANLYK